MKYAHSLENMPVDHWQSLDEHLEKVADLSGSFASKFNSESWGKLLGFVHDFGKSRKAFEDYLLHCNGLLDREYDNHEHSHSGAGACYLKTELKFGHFLAYCAAGHHTGLPDGSIESGPSSLPARLRNESKVLDEEDVKQWIEQHTDILTHLKSELKFPWKLDQDDMALWIRMLFSCLVDADFLDTENFMDNRKASIRSQYPDITVLSEHFFRSLDVKQDSASPTPVNQIRAEIRNQCEKMSLEVPGIFSLTVPTGGGKTLSSMAFAFKHALKYKKQRIIYVIPYTSIIEQTSAILREFLGADNVVEHHSNFDPEQATMQSNLAAENWDAPIIVTTTVQFFESLFSSKSSRCRKLHNITDSVIILDEVQLLPPSLLLPCKDMIRQLSKHYGVTFVMSTATQPNHSGLDVTEIIPGSMKLFDRLKRVDIKFPRVLTERKSWDDIAFELVKHKQVLCIVNTRSDCRELYEKMPAGTIHLSALMCGDHRSKVIAEIKQRLRDDADIRVIATNLVEAGVDIDFPVVFRAYTGLPSIMQSAGRCNREGKLASPGEMVVFVPPKPSPMGELKKAEETLTELLQLPEKYSPDDSASYPRFFEAFYSKINDNGTVFKKLLVSKVRDGIIQFHEASEKFRMIDDTYTIPLVVFYGDNASMIESLKIHGPRRDIMRKLQRSIVNIPRYIMDGFVKQQSVKEIHPGIFIQNDPDLYDPSFGVNIKLCDLEMKDLIL